MEELAADLFGKFDIDPERFGLDLDDSAGAVDVEGSVITARLVEFADDGTINQHFTVRVEVIA